MAATTTARNIALCLPSRGSLDKVEIGVAPGERVAAMEPPAPPNQKKVIVYGTSILHGDAVKEHQILADARVLASSHAELLEPRRVESPPSLLRTLFCSAC